MSEKQQIYDELSMLLTNYEEGNDVYSDDLYEMLVKIQSSWETIITVQED